MDPVSVSIVVSAPREQVFDYLQDIANHPEFTDHYLVDWHLTRMDSVGRGAGARFRVKAPGNRFSWADVTFAEVDRPHRIVEIGPHRQEQPHPHPRRLRAGRGGRGHPRVTSRSAPNRPRCGTGSARASARATWFKRKNTRALQRLRGILEEGVGARAAGDRCRWLDCRLACDTAPAAHALAALGLVAVMLLAGCGDSHSRVTTGTYAGESGANAPYLDVGPLIYEVQISRQLNPWNNGDSTYLQGVPPSQDRLLPGQEWFGVSLQVYNETTHPLLATNAITLTDTQGNVYGRSRSAPRTCSPTAAGGRALQRHAPDPRHAAAACSAARASCCCSRSPRSRSTTARWRSKSSTR